MVLVLNGGATGRPLSLHAAVLGGQVATMSTDRSEDVSHGWPRSDGDTVLSELHVALRAMRSIRSQIEAQERHRNDRNTDQLDALAA